MPPLQALLRGVFAGNVFDLGAASTAEKFNEGRGSGAMFHSARASLAARPWAVDHCEEVSRR